MTCTDCAQEINRWIDAFTDWGPIRGWRQYQSTDEARQRRSTEMHAIKVDDRARLIRQQVALIREQCDHLNEVAA